MLIYPGPERRARRRFQRRLTPFSSVLPFHICNEVMIPVCDITLQTAEQPACRDCSHWLSLLGGGWAQEGKQVRALCWRGGKTTNQAAGPAGELVGGAPFGAQGPRFRVGR